MWEQVRALLPDCPACEMHPGLFCFLRYVDNSFSGLTT